ncbi:zinc finger protein 510-like isoform X1 [Tamandua tetradactyla]|uniref:zinc finger protein 510-like isoform X1 n=1 Tax=Tamandua tetradactyla TaxID=48850 RepID=UPI0040543A46
MVMLPHPQAIPVHVTVDIMDKLAEVAYPFQFSALFQKEQKLNISQASVSLTEVAVVFPQEKWQLLGPVQRTLYSDMMLENYRCLPSVGETGTKSSKVKQILVPESGVLLLQFVNTKDVEMAF